jgi:hypothetical protein
MLTEPHIRTGRVAGGAGGETVLAYPGEDGLGAVSFAVIAAGLRRAPSAEATGWGESRGLRRPCSHT